MKLKYDFAVREVAGKTVAIPVGEATENFDCMITLNESGAFIFNLLKQEITEEEILKAFLKEYDATEQQAKGTIDAFLEKLKNSNIL